MPQRYEGKWVLSDTNTRSLVKTISWRLTGSTATFIISYILLGNAAISGTIALTQMAVNTALYFIHERIWNKLKWGIK